MNSKPNYLLIGSGRVAKHFAQYFTFLGVSYTFWSRGNTSADLARLAAAADRILLLISDSAIDGFYQTHRDILPVEKLAHFSGAFVHASIPSAHPLMTFGPELYDLDTYKRIAFITEQGRGTFAALLPGLPNPHFEISPEKKTYYHALCSLSGNFTTLLWESIAKKFNDELGLPATALQPYLEQTFLNLLKQTSESVMTGPLKRGDTDTIVRHLDSLRNQPEQTLYYAFMNYYFSQNPTQNGDSAHERFGL